MEENDYNQTPYQVPPSVPQAPPPAPKKSFLAGFGGGIMGVFACLGLGLLLIVVGSCVAVMGSTDTDSDATTASQASVETTVDDEGGEDPAETTEASEEPVANEQEVYPLGTPGDTGDLTVTITEVVDPYTDYHEFETPGPGMRFVAVSMTVVNNDDDETYVTSLDMTVTDDQNRTGEVDIWIVDDNKPDISGEIARGSSKTGWVFLEVPEDAAGLQLRIKGSFTANGALFALS